MKTALRLGLGFLCFGALTSPAIACFGSIDSAKMFDAPPTELAHGARLAKFEVLEYSGQYVRIKLHKDLFDRKKGDVIRVLAPWNSCIIVAERLGAEYGAVSVVRDGDGLWRYYLHTYDFEDRGWWPFYRRIAVGKPFPANEMELGTEIIEGWG